MKVIRNPKKCQNLLTSKRSRLSIGFVPTMGALHAGHISLVEKSVKENDFTVVSIFVNPTQFGPNEDFSRYPRTLKADLALLEKAKADLVFVPDAKSMYSNEEGLSVKVGKVAENLCGAFRPGHFDGVATIVAKLFNIILPHTAYFGAKDYQQTVVIKQLVQDLYFPIKIKVEKTVRETDGLAMSSRNRYLSFEERKRALSLIHSLRWMESEIKKGKTHLKKVKAKGLEILKRSVDSVDYLEIVDPETLVPLQKSQKKMVAAIACSIGKTRLIDNLTILQ